MTDPTIVKMDIGFEVCAIAAFVWASIDYHRFIKFWMIRPAPYGRRVVIGFRLFFLACVLGGAWQLAETIFTSARPAMFYLSALPLAAAWFVVFFLMLHLVERMNRKRNKQSRQQ